ncbi:hypothetical protein BT96DRAFT_1003797 [Gymnopus androsaceus JB14]|uniref:Uncharacterized protein n=1 Tax=Gymnopus androsaceus JB14 TaxID=1447944 RepID=A0A6A4GST0_9AGAR|nr:hypothetical protein BT96DRAFT_1003797 [Gymnopus androsaceus JB14]
MSQMARHPLKHAQSLLDVVSSWVRDSLLNPESEKIMVTADESTDEEICKAVLSAQMAKEDTVVNGGDDDVDNDG